MQQPGFFRSIRILSLFFFLSSESMSVWSQICIDLPEINGIPQSYVSPSGWDIWSSSPDIIAGNGNYPGTAQAVIADVNGNSIAGGEMAFFLINGALGSNTEGIRTQISGLTPGTSYNVAVQWQQVKLDYTLVTNDPAGGRLGMYIDGINLGTFSSNGGIDDPWQIAYISFTATATMHTLGLKGILLGNGNNGAIVVDNLPCGIPLPVEIGDFELIHQDQVGVELRWKTYSERDNDYFAIERSADALNWQTIGVVDGVGTSSQTTEYSFMDASPLDQKAYYRLQQHDFNGNSSYSLILCTSELAQTIQTIRCFPNPATTQITVVGSDLKTLVLTDLTGRTIDLKPLLITVKETNCLIDISSLPPGAYLFSAGGSTVSFKKL